MAIDLTDDGTLDTVLRCDACGEEFRFTYSEGPNDDSDHNDRCEHGRRADDGCEDCYDAWVDSCVEDAGADHECPAYAPAVESLQTRGFDTSYATTDGAHIGCSQCQAVAINGIACHETGCPHVRRMDEED